MPLVGQSQGFVLFSKVSQQRFFKALLALFLFAFTLLNASEYYGAIEIGGKGVKSYFIEVDDVKTMGKIVERTSSNTAPQSGIGTDLVMSASMIESIASEIATMKANLIKHHHLGDSHIFVIGSSAINKIHNKEALSHAISSKAHQALFFINEQEESIFAFYGAIPKDVWGKSAMIDIGGGNTKIAWKNEKNATMDFIEIPLGTVSLSTKSLEGNVTQPFHDACLEHITHALPASHHLKEKATLYASGGIFWATAYLKMEGHLSAFTPLQESDFQNVIETFSTPFECSKTQKSPQCFLLDYYGTTHLVAGALLAKETIKKLDFFEKNVVFAKEGGWVIGWLLATSH